MRQIGRERGKDREVTERERERERCTHMYIYYMLSVKCVSKYYQKSYYLLTLDLSFTFSIYLTWNKFYGEMCC